MAPTTRPVVFMDINIGETPAGRMKMELYSDIVPKYVIRDDLARFRADEPNAAQEPQRTSVNCALGSIGMYLLFFIMMRP
jgi:hypothetical protein